MRIIALFLSLVLLVFFAAAIVWFVFFKPPDATVSVDKYFAVIGGIMSLLLTAMTAAIAFVTFRAKEREREVQQPVRNASTRQKPPAIKRVFDATPYSVKSGVFGGFVGGVIGGGVAGLINGIHYYYMSQSYPSTSELHFVKASAADVLKIASTVLVVAAIFGVLIQYFIVWFRRLAVERNLPGLVFNELFGGIIGGLIGGPFVGLAFGVLSGDKNTPPPDIGPVFWGGILCVVCILLGALVYERRTGWSGILLALAITAFIAFISYSLFAYALVKLGYTPQYFIKPGAGIDVAVERAAKLGLPIGALWGIQIGGTLLVFRLVLSLLGKQAKAGRLGDTASS